MLPSRGLSSRISPASALRHSTKVLRTSHAFPPRQFSQLSSQSRNAPIIRGNTTSSPRFSSIGSHGPSVASLRAGVGALGGASTVFANRAGASRNLSLWPFGGSKKPSPSETTPAEAAATSPTPPEADAQASFDAATPTTDPATDPATSPDVLSTSFVDDPVSPVSSPAATETEPLLDSSLDSLDFTSILDIPEQIGYLKSLGLDFGWGPAATCEWLLEHIYVYTGLPWWGTLAVVSVLWRAVLFVPTLRSTRSSALIQTAHRTPEYQKALADFKAATYYNKDQAAMMRARAQMKAITSKSGANYLWIGVPFLTIPFSFGMFRVIRGISGIPVPSFETGGFAWFTDLTVHDPFYILPIANVVMGYLMMVQNQKANMNSNPVQQNMMKSLMYIFPPVIFLSMAWLPAGMQWFFMCLTLTTVVQTTATLNPAVRRWAGIPRLPSYPSGFQGGGSSGILYQAPIERGSSGKDEGIVKNITKGVQQSLGQDSRKKELEKAQDYEARRAAEEKEKAYKRMEEARRKRAAKKQAQH